MTTYTKDEIVVHAKELAKMIAQTEEVDFFKQAEEKINENQKVHRVINQIKSLQKEAVNLEHYGKKEALKKVEEQLTQLQDSLEALPIVQQFQSSQVEVNALLQLVTSTISNTVTDEIIIATEGDVRKGQTGSQIAASKDDGCNGCENCDCDS